MAKITKLDPEYGMPANTPVLPGVRAICDEHAGPKKGCGTEFVTEGNEQANGTWLAGGDRSQAGGATMGWIITCPRCGRGVRVLHPYAPKLENYKPKPDSCFVATCCFGDLNAPEVITLRGWRDNTLCTYALGRKFTAWYYNGLGEYLARKVSGRPTLCKLGRTALSLFIRLAIK